jgi:NAD(P)-dependent dehydrogenase (short-subunit alcohol dehydrogenase family)
MSRDRDDPFAGKSVFVAGGTSGMNLETAKRFAAAGSRVAVVSRNLERVDATAAMLRKTSPDSLGMVCDVRDAEAVDDAIVRASEAVGPFDVVIAGQAGNFLCAAADLSPNGFRAVVDIDLIGSFNVFRAAYAHLRKPGASLIAVTAPQAVQPQMSQIHVCAAKAGVNMLVKCLALEWGGEGIRVNAVCPGPIEGSEGMKRLAPGEEALAHIKSRLPLRRLGTTDDIVEAVGFLVSPAADYVTGLILDCDGGLNVSQGGYRFGQ